MILQTMLEEIEMSVPSPPGRTRLIFDINNAMREFCEKTRVLYALATLTRSANLISEDTERQEWIYSVPNDLWEIRSADCCSQDEIEMGDGQVTFYFVAEPEEDIHIEYSRYPAVLTLLSNTPELHELFQPAIIAKVKEKYFRLAGDLNSAAAERGIWLDGIREGLRFANTRPLRNLATVTGSLAAGTRRRVLGRTSLVQGLNTVTIPLTAGQTMASIDYLIMWDANIGVQVTEYDPNNNRDQRTTTSFKVLAADAVPNYEFIVEDI